MSDEPIDLAQLRERIEAARADPLAGWNDTASEYHDVLLALIDTAEAALKVASQISPWATGDMGALQRALARFTTDPVVVRTPDGTSGPTQIFQRYELPWLTRLHLPDAEHTPEETA